MHIVLLQCPHVQIAFLKFTSCDNQALVGCIPIAAVAVHLNVKSRQSSHKMYSDNIVNFQVSTTISNACTKKSGNLLKAAHNSHITNHPSKLSKACRDTAEKARMNSLVTFLNRLLHMVVPVLPYQRRLTYISSVQTQDEAWMTWREQRTIGMDREK